MLGWFLDVGELTRQTAIRLLGSRVVWLLGLSIVAVAIGLMLIAPRAARQGATGIEFVGISTYLLVFMFGLPVSALYLGVAAVHGDLEDRTATFLFVRPLRRSALLVGKWLAAAALAWSLASAAIGAFYAAVSLAAPLWSRGLAPTPDLPTTYALAAGLAAAAYAAVGALFGAVFRRPLVAGAVFFVGWEFVASVAPPQAGIRGFTVAGPVRGWLLQELRIDPGSDLRDVLTMGLDDVRLAGMTDPLASVLRFAVGALLLALWIYCRREYDSRPRD